MIETQYVDRFAFAHITPTELKPETVDLLWTQIETKAGEGTNYGIGWGVYFDGEGNRFVGPQRANLHPTSPLFVKMAPVR